MIKGIDISSWQEGFQLSKAKSAGYEFAILRGGFTGYGTNRVKNKDKCFEDFYKQAKSIGMPVGAYWYSCADTADQGKIEAEFFYNNCLKGKQFEYPIYIDVEDEHWQVAKKKAVTDAIIAFCEYLEAKGYFVGIYASLNWFKNYIDTSRLTAYTKWVAAWMNAKPSVTFNAFDMWQYSSTTKISGTNMDVNQCFVDFPTVIKAAGKNGYTIPAQDPVPDPMLKVKETITKASGLMQEAIDMLKSIE